MVCKEDVVSWFNELESYKRIETMCTLLNMCLPFELRFLGTCIEGLGRRDFQLLRGVSHSVNTAKELTAIYDSCLTGGPSDQRIRRKLALYVALLRFGKIDCVNDLFRVLAGWDLADLLNVPSGVPLEEILLLYTLAHWHPVFNFEQRQHCGNIVKRLTEERISENSAYQYSQGGLRNLTRPLTQVTPSMQDHIPLIIPTVPMTNTSQSLIGAVSHHSHTVPNTAQIRGDVTPITNISPVPSNSPAMSNSPSAQLSLQSPSVMGSHPITNEALLPGGHLLQPIIAVGEFTIPHGPWTRATAIVPPLGPPSQIEVHTSFTTTSPSPQLLNQSDSPAHSRAGSPSSQQPQQYCKSVTNQQPQQIQHQIPSNFPGSRTSSAPPRPPLMVGRMQRRPSNDPTPPPCTTENTILNTQSKDMIRVPKHDLNLAKAGLKHLRNFTLHEVSHMDEDKIGIPTGTMNELRTLVNCNGVCIANCTSSPGQQNHCQVPLNRSKLSHQPPITYCASQLKVLRLDADSSLHQSSASESGSSGSAGHSPPDTPAMMESGNINRARERCRLNGRPEKPFNKPLSDSSSSSGLPSGTIPANTQYYLPHHVTSSTRSVFGFQHTYRPPPQLPFQQSPNGDLVYPFPPHPYLHPVPVYTPSNVQRSCYNCGGTGHSGTECKELTMEEIARPGLYQLDYTNTSSSTASTPDLAAEK